MRQHHNLRMLFYQMSLCAFESKLSQSSLDPGKGSGVEGKVKSVGYRRQRTSKGGLSTTSATTKGHLDVRVYSKCCYVTRWDLNRLDM